MDFNKIPNNNFIVSDNIINFCQKAINISEKSKDKLHDQYHLERILKNAILFIKENPNLPINFEVLFISICWHDVWKNTFNSSNLIKLLCNYFLDGIGSVIILIPFSLLNKISLRTTVGSSYAILVHPRFNFLPLLTNEAKILRDLDVLDEFSKERFTELKKTLMNKKRSLYFYILKKYFEIFLKKENKFYFEWVKNLYIVIKTDYIQTVSSLIN